MKQLARRFPAVAALCIAALVAGVAVADDLDQKLEAARTALNKAEFKQAALLYQQIHLEAREAGMAGNALYWEAFARYRLNRTEELKKAIELLKLQQEDYPDVETIAEGEALSARIYGELAKRGEAEAAMKVRQRLEDEDLRAETQMAALHALMQMDPEKARPVLIKIARGEKKVGPEIRRNAIFMLCREGEEESEALLIDLLETSDDPELQSELVMCLSMADSDRALDAIVRFFQANKGSHLGEEALYAIGHHGGERAFALLKEIVADRTDDDEVRAQALFSLSRVGRDDEVAELLTGILATETSPEILEMALFALSDLDSEIPDKVFMDLIDNPAADEELRAHALYFAAQRDQVSLQFIQQVYMQTDSREMKQQICHVLTRMDDEAGALEALIAIVREEKDPEIRRDAVFWIGQFDDPKAAEFLLEIINED